MKIILLTVLFGLGSTLTTSNCPSGVTKDAYLQVFGQNCFKFHTSGHLDYYDARELCAKANGHLAMPKDKATNDFLAEQLGKYGVTKDSWIGLNDEEREDSYFWEDDSPMAWENFGANEGTNHKGNFIKDWEDCIAMTPKSGTWHDHHCDSEFFGLINEHKPFVCEYPAEQSVGAGTTPCPAIECNLDCGFLGYKQDSSNCFICACDS